MLPAIVWLVPDRLTVPELWVKVPAVRENRPDTFRVVGAVNVPVVWVKSPFMVTVWLPPVKVAPLFEVSVNGPLMVMSEFPPTKVPLRRSKPVAPTVRVTPAL